MKIVQDFIINKVVAGPSGLALIGQLSISNGSINNGQQNIKTSMFWTINYSCICFIYIFFYYTWWNKNFYIKSSSYFFCNLADRQKKLFRKIWLFYFEKTITFLNDGYLYKIFLWKQQARLLQLQLGYIYFLSFLLIRFWSR